MFYNIFSIDTDELVDSIFLSDPEKNLFIKANPNVYLEMFGDNIENPLNIFDPYYDDMDYDD